MKVPIPRTSLFLFAVFLLVACCPKKESREALILEINRTEKEFEKATWNKGIREAFWLFADENAVIKRGNDSLIKGRAGIRNFYGLPSFREVTVTWKPDFTDVSTDGTLGYTYGRYTWRSKDKSGRIVEDTGVFHTIWKRQSAGTWRYVWD